PHPAQQQSTLSVSQFTHLRTRPSTSWTRWSRRRPRTRRPRCATSLGPLCAAALAHRRCRAAARRGHTPAASGPARWRRRVAATGEFRYDPLSYALNLDDGERDTEDAAFLYRNFNSRLPPSPVPAAQRLTTVTIA
uniref:Uncharacterized protein n=1 Tax=Aegilops tauschii subsp. strangulata TaxID=200361 RepID=A0A453SIX9_AEGTS